MSVPTLHRKVLRRWVLHCIKSVVIRLTESMAAELRDKNINVNCVLPTIIDTPENRTAMPNADPSGGCRPKILPA